MPDNEPGSGPVIVGVDGSQRSVEALALADLLGPLSGTRWSSRTCTHTGSCRASSRRTSTRRSSVRWPSRPSTRSENISRRCRSDACNSSPTKKLLEGDARELLARESGELDQLVVGSRGYGPLRAVLLGSVSSALVRSAQSPLVVLSRTATGDYRE
jgi:hypothetical protein